MKGGLRTRYRALHMRAQKVHCTDELTTDVPKNTGFTIVEVMIVLAITGGLFISAAVMISGRTNKAQFEQSINQITAQLRQSINEVSTGYYPNRGFQCQANGATVSITAGTTEQGTNSGCMLLGKALQFGVQNTDPEQFISFPIAGRQQLSDGTQVTSLSAAGPKVISPSTSLASVPDSTDKQTLQYGLKVSKMYYNTEANPIGTVAFVTTLAQYEGSQITSGAQRINLMPVSGTALNQTQRQAAELVNTRLATSPVRPSGGVFICFDSGTTNQSGLVQIGGDNRQLSVTLTIKGNKGC